MVLATAVQIDKCQHNHIKAFVQFLNVFLSRFFVEKPWKIPVFYRFQKVVNFGKSLVYKTVKTDEDYQGDKTSAHPIVDVVKLIAHNQ